MDPLLMLTPLHYFFVPAYGAAHLPLPPPLILSDSYPWMLPSRALGLHWICPSVISSTSSFIGEPLHARELSGVKMLFDGYNRLKG